MVSIPLSAVRSEMRYRDNGELSEAIPAEEASKERERVYTYRARALRDMIQHSGPMGTAQFWRGVFALEDLSEPPTHRARYVIWVGPERFQPSERRIVGPVEEVEVHPRDSQFRQRFLELAEAWHRETDHLSSVSDIVLNFNYQRIIGMGPSVIPLILDELGNRGGHWFWALRALSGEDPVRIEDRGNVVKMTEAWLDWFRNRS
jgi:hypothetical protein